MPVKMHSKKLLAKFRFFYKKLMDWTYGVSQATRSKPCPKKNCYSIIYQSILQEFQQKSMKQTIIDNEVGECGCGIKSRPRKKPGKLSKKIKFLQNSLRKRTMQKVDIFCVSCTGLFGLKLPFVYYFYFCHVH